MSLLLPYRHQATPPGGDGTVEVVCKAPLIDLTTPENLEDDWFLLAPPDGADATSIEVGSVQTGDSACSPASFWRVGIGALVALAGVGAVVAAIARRPGRDRSGPVERPILEPILPAVSDEPGEGDGDGDPPDEVSSEA